MTVLEQEQPLPNAFVWRRLHSLAGFGLVIFLFFHLLTNSMAALFVGEDGRSFIEQVNAIHHTPYLRIIEVFLLGLPILVHTLWGIKYLFTGEINSYPTDGTKPSLPEYPRNKAYTWQRITSWLLIVGIVVHVVHMRFIDFPVTANVGSEQSYAVRISYDEGLPLLADRLGVHLYNDQQIAEMKNLPMDKKLEKAVQKQREHENEAWIRVLQGITLDKNERIAVADNFGTVELLVVRDTFKMPSMMILYTIFVLAATFHAFNGMWTFMISWGVTLSQRSQRLMRYLTVSLMALTTFLGLAAIWMTYWVNLKT